MKLKMEQFTLAGVRVLTIACVLAGGNISRADEIRFESVGVRSGFTATSLEDDFYQGEAYSTLQLPWGWDWGPDWRLQMGMDASIGVLSRLGDHGLIATAGPTFRLKWDRLPVSAIGGCSPTILSRDSYQNVDFDIPFQFTSHFGFGWDVTRHSFLGYRFQHMSNAGLGGGDNPGLNFHLFSIAYRF
jgi:hypothetical protein